MENGELLIRSQRKSKTAKKKNKRNHYKRKLQTSDQLEESKIVDEEYLYWQNRKDKYQTQLSTLLSYGLPLIQVTSYKQQPKNLLENLAIYLEGAKGNKSIYNLARECQNKIEDKNIDIDQLVDLITEQCEVKNYLINEVNNWQEFNQQEVFQITFNEFKIYGNNSLISCDFNIYELINTHSLRCWGDIEDFEYIRKVRQHIVSYIKILQEIINEIENENNNYTKIQEKHKQLIQLKNQKIELQIQQISPPKKKEQINTIKNFIQIKKKHPDKEQDHLIINKKQSIFLTIGSKPQRPQEFREAESFIEFANCITFCNQRRFTPHKLNWTEDYKDVYQKKANRQRKYFFVTDSKKQLDKYRLMEHSKTIRPKKPLEQDHNLINYDLDSEDEILDLKGEDVIVSSSSDQESLDEEFYAESVNGQSFLIPDEEIFKGNYNRVHYEQASKADYKPFQFKIEDCQEKPQMQEFFQRYEIQILIPLKDLKEIQKEETQTRKQFFKDKDNIIKFLLFTHGNRLSINTMQKQFVSENPNCSKYAFDKKLRTHCQKLKLDNYGDTWMVNIDDINEYGLQDLCQEAFSKNIEKQEQVSKLKSIQFSENKKSRSKKKNVQI